MKPLYTLMAAMAVSAALAQSPKQRDLKTDIQEVTVFLSSAQIVESGTASLPAGKSLLRITHLSPYIDANSILARSEGDITILSVNHNTDFLTSPNKTAETDSLQKRHRTLTASLTAELARLTVLTEKQNTLSANQKLSPSANTTTQLKQLLQLYESELTAIKTEEIQINSRVEKMKDQQRAIERQLNELSAAVAPRTGTIEILVSAETAVTATLSVSYLVSNAGWFPKYDIRVNDIKSPLQLTYKAEVFQQTGVDWKNVKLRFSNGDPKQNGTIPDLNPWVLQTLNNYSHRYIRGTANGMAYVKGIIIGGDDKQPVPGANVHAKGTTVGTVTDANGNYSLDLPANASTLVVSFIGYKTMEIPITRSELNIVLHSDTAELNEVVVSAQGFSSALAGKLPGVQIRGASSVPPLQRTISTFVVENQTTVEIAITTPYTIESNGDRLQVDLRTYDITADYAYFAVPKADLSAFLVARITNWDQYNLLEGEANLYFEDAFVGRSILDAKSLSDTLNISLGRDRSIIIGREKVDQFTRRRAIGTNTVETRGYKITVRNKKSQAIHLTLTDQIPLTFSSDITISPIELSGGKLTENSGQVKWELTIEKSQQKEVILNYEVRYPKKERVALQ